MTSHRPASTETAPELAGMALRNGVLMLGPTQWAVAIRERDGSIVTASEPRPAAGEKLSHEIPMLRGPVRMVNMFRTLPRIRRAVPQLRFGMESREIAAGMVVSSVVARLVRRRYGSGAMTELFSGVSSLGLTMLAMRGGEVAAYHGAEHKTIRGFELGEDPAGVPKEHPRCGTQLAIPMLAFTAIATQVALALAPQSPAGARIAGQLVGLAAATELFRAAQRGKGGALARGAAAAGLKLQAVATTTEPNESQLEVAAASLDALLTAERRAGATA